MTKSHFYGHEFALKTQIKFEVQTLLILPPESPVGMIRNNSTLFSLIQTLGKSHTKCFHTFRYGNRQL